MHSIVKSQWIKVIYMISRYSLM